MFVISVWEPPPWKIFTNCYVILQYDGGVVFIDAGRANHAPLLTEALHPLDKHFDDVRLVIATHNHQDHVGCSPLMTRAIRLVHPLDYLGLPAEVRPLFTQDLKDLPPDFQYIHLGWHTPGSIALLHRPTGILFCGDHLGFYHRPDEGVVGFGQEIRRRACLCVSEWAANSEERHKDRFDLWLEGVRLLQSYPISALCPGHGGVLDGGISDFLQELVNAGGYE